MKTIQEMAQKATGATGTLLVLSLVGIKELKAFAALVREDERNRAQRENAYVAAEREACAKVVLSIANADAGNPYKQALRMGAEAIRARGQA